MARGNVTYNFIKTEQYFKLWQLCRSCCDKSYYHDYINNSRFPWDNINHLVELCISNVIIFSHGWLIWLVILNDHCLLSSRASVQHNSNGYVSMSWMSKVKFVLQSELIRPIIFSKNTRSIVSQALMTSGWPPDSFLSRCINLWKWIYLEKAIFCDIYGS